MIRPAEKQDLAAIRSIAERTDMFLGDELAAFTAELAAHLNADDDAARSDAGLIVAVNGESDASPVIGAAYFAPETMAQGVMNLLFIGVAPEARRVGAGRSMLGHFEGVARAGGARLAIIETAGDAMFAPAWALYRNAGYEEAARIRDYYDDDLDKLIFRKPI
ncbi:MAG: GNAT family N-acetyltransferase [Pseudomonadota bacterium]